MSQSLQEDVLLALYIYKVLKQKYVMHPDTDVFNKAMAILNSFVITFSKKLSLRLSN